jgi:hypothetical protein
MDMVAKLTEETLYAILSGKGARSHTLAAFRATADLHEI